MGAHSIAARREYLHELEQLHQFGDQHRHVLFLKRALAQELRKLRASIQLREVK